MGSLPAAIGERRVSRLGRRLTELIPTLRALTRLACEDRNPLTEASLCRPIARKTNKGLHDIHVTSYFIWWRIRDVFSV
nr:hypothetical protein [Burkholderia sp. TSV86]